MEDTPYTPYVDKLLERVRFMTKAQIDCITKQFLHWYSNEPIPVTSDEPLEDNQTKLHEFLEKSKRTNYTSTDKASGYPAPYRCLPIGFDPEVRTTVPTWNSYLNSTFSTLTADDDVLKIISFRFDSPLNIETYEKLMYSKLLTLPSYLSALCESDLLSKINCQRGYFYHNNHSVGICWNSKTRDSLVYSCFYYSYQNPYNEKMIGRWDYINGYYRSATFKVSRGEIDYCKTLPVKMSNLFASCYTLVGKDCEIVDVLNMVNIYTSVMLHSSWNTTKLCSDMRFVVTTHFAKSNRSRNLAANQFKEPFPLKSCDYIFATLINRYVQAKPNYNLTPLFGLPIRFMSIEKTYSSPCIGI
jgi:hypothetical protein